MNRRYRVWCKNKNEWEKDAISLWTNGTLIHRCNNGIFTILKEETHIVQFYTGLKDCTGKDVYEGDVVSWWHYEGVVTFKNGAFCICSKDHDDVYFSEYAKLNLTLQTMKVIGNIFEEANNGKD